MEQAVMTETGQRVWESLTPREQVMLTEFAGTADDVEVIAERLGLKRGSIHSYWQRLKDKTGMSTRLELIHFAMKNRMVPCLCGRDEEEKCLTQ